MNDLVKNWERIEAWLHRSVPEALDELQPPATQEKFERVIATVGELPDDYRTLMRIHDGVDKRGYRLGVLEGYVLYSLQEALDTRAMMQRVIAETHSAYPDRVDRDVRPDPGVRQSDWHDGWLPIAVAAGDARTLIFLDLDPAPGGTRGQLVRHVIDMDTLPIVARSVAEWIARVANAMESGRAIVEREPGADEDDDDLIYLMWSLDDDA